MRTCATTGTDAGGALIAAVVVRRGDPEGRRTVAQLAQCRGWQVVGVYEIGTGDVQRRLLMDAYSGTFRALLIPSISDLGPTPAAALAPRRPLP